VKRSQPRDAKISTVEHVADIDHEAAVDGRASIQAS